MKAWKKAALVAAIVSGILVPTALVLAGQAQQEANPVLDIDGDMTDLTIWRSIVQKYPQHNLPVNSSTGSWILPFMLAPSDDLPFTPDPESKVVVFSVFNAYYSQTYHIYGFKAPNLTGWYLSTYSWTGERDELIIDSLLYLSETYEG